MSVYIHVCVSALTPLSQIFPSLALMMFMRQPRIEGLHWLQDVVWCAWAGEADAAGFRSGEGEARPLRPETESTE